MTEEPTGKTVIKLYMPPFEIENIQKQMLQQFTIPISAKERALMQQLVDQYDHIIAFTDGASVENPGKAGAGASFYGVAKPTVLQSFNLTSGSDLSELSQDESEPKSLHHLHT